MDHSSVNIEYHEEKDQHHLNMKPFTPISDDKKYERKSDLFIIDDHPELAWLKGFRIEGFLM